jgi:hypothetical protein
VSVSKFKSENYQQFGGINSKSSPYTTGPMEFLDLSNLDFQTPGSLSQRWGSTQYIGQTFPGPIQTLFEYSRLDGSSWVIQGYSGGIFFGATTGQTQGLSFTLQSATFSSFTYLTHTARLGVNPFTPQEGGQDLGIPYLGDLSQFAGSSLFVVAPTQASSGNLSFGVLDNYLFAGDGNKFFKFDGITTTPVGLPPTTRPLGPTTGVANSASLYYTNLSGASDFVGLGMVGTYTFYLSYVNNRGFEGPLWPMHIFNGASFLNGSTAAAAGGTYLAIRFPVVTPLQYGISAINQYIYWSATSTPAALLLPDPDLWNGYGEQMRLISTTPASGSTVSYVLFGSTTGGQTMITTNAGALPPTNNYQPPGITLINQGPYTVTSEVDQVQFAPRYVETYQNRLFLAGFSTQPSTVWFSDVAEPEGYRPDFNFEVRTNDGDVITALKSYSTRLYVFKLRSFHVLSGDNPNNFSLQQVSDQYGALNNRCVVLYDDILLFLDEKGVMMWNGAGITRLSDKIKPLFERMNYSAAISQACMVHDKLRSQVLVAFPIDGSTTNNITAVYDYMIGAWTHYDGVSPSALAAIRGRNNSKNAFYGDYSGRVNWFGPSFLSDNGVGFTTYIKTRFLHDLGDSDTKTFRRLFLNTDSPASSTLTFKVNFFQDYGSSVVLGTTIVLSQFQNRIDFGIQNAKSLAFELSTFQSTLPLKIHGFTVESALRRRV